MSRCAATRFRKNPGLNSMGVVVEPGDVVAFELAQDAILAEGVAQILVPAMDDEAQSLDTVMVEQRHRRLTRLDSLETEMVLHRDADRRVDHRLDGRRCRVQLASDGERVRGDDRALHHDGRR